MDKEVGPIPVQDDELDPFDLQGVPVEDDGEELSLVQVRHLIDNLNSVQPPKKKGLLSSLSLPRILG